MEDLQIIKRMLLLRSSVVAEETQRDIRPDLEWAAELEAKKIDLTNLKAIEERMRLAKETTEKVNRRIAKGKVDIMSVP